ncbi:hypothetical protein ABTL49_19340, partial [Acinetobacter baumannii]
KGWVLGLFALPIGLLLGCCMVLLQELLNRRLRLSSDLNEGMFGSVIGILDSVDIKQQSQNSVMINSDDTNKCIADKLSSTLLERFLLP